MTARLLQLRVLAPGLLLGVTAVACGPGVRGPDRAAYPAGSLPLPFSAVTDASGWRVPAETAAGEQLVSLVDGDYDLPALSPDGRWIAFVEVARSDTVVRSRVRVRSLDDDGGRVLLGYDLMDTFAVAAYSPWVRHLAWRGSDTLVAAIADGDVGTTTLAVAVPSGEILSESYAQGHPSEPLPPAQVGLRDRLLEAFPGWRPEVVASALRNGQVLETGDGVLVQKRYAGEDGHVRWLDWGTGDTTRVLTMPRTLESRGELGPGLTVADRTLFPIVSGDRAHLFGFRPGEELVSWGSVPTERSHYVQLREVARTGGGVLAELDVASGASCCRHSPVLWITADRLVEWTDYGSVDDVDARLEHGLVAWTHWTTTPDTARALRVHRRRR